MPLTVTCLCLSVAITIAMTPVASPAEEASATETIVLVRHGEKPALGLGQLDCQGLNRALALPAVIDRQFGKPAAIFAPDPAEQKDDGGQPYDYVRPLATIEPTAIALGLPVDASIGVSNVDGLRQKLEAPAYRNALVLVAWEHREIVEISRHLMVDFGADPAGVPDWKGRDFDGIYVVKITRTGQGTTATFERRHEGLDAQPTICPGRAPG